ncbi:uncharacterized protein LOC110446917 [Mizuhopecten yessoensis]|uniref:uncharacterized protein LOC110446917 n=1 Tax=Mizuhopecten yessoensis TaxID=6573 RepID=UPI000B45E7C1|nr:uncharacterized protein LOC110446917 [Mizuhopecten yessoensis]
MLCHQFFPFKDTSMEESPRQKRLKTRENRSALQPEQDSQPPDHVQSEVVIESSEISRADTFSTCLTSTYTQSTQYEINSLGMFSVDFFRSNAKMMNYYTGFVDFAQFMLFYQCLGPCVNELCHQGSLLDPRDQLFMVLMKLRQAKEDVELSLFFKVSESTVSRIVVTWINFLYFQLKELDIWPSKEIIKEYMPSDFHRKFPNTRVILDATELPIQKPSDVNAQSATWSSYKHKNTLKAMIGCTPRGVVSFVSDAYGGSASDRQIIENSSLLNESVFDKGDSIMADRGIMVQDLFATNDVYVNTPTMLKGKSQLDPEEVVHDRRVASKRIHIERIIGLSKGFKILKKELPQSKLQLGSRIVFVCFAISNFRNCIVDKYA